jgi:hypothetical protein
VLAEGRARLHDKNPLAHDKNRRIAAAKRTPSGIFARKDPRERIRVTRSVTRLHR